MLLNVSNLKTSFFNEKGIVKAVDGVSFHVKKRETFGIVGESGSGKTATALSILRLIPSPGGRIVDGEIRFKGKDLLKLSTKEIRKLRGSHLTMIPQDPMTSLNPVYRIGNQIGEALKIHRNMRTRHIEKHVVAMLRSVHITSAQKRVREYPHEFSGGMKQRAIIAMSMLCRPELIIADEPTTALDVTIQAQILRLLREVQDRFDTSIILITHDLGIVASMCSRVAVMYAGTIVEQADVRTIFKKPKHPYTRLLIESVPRIGRVQRRLTMIEGQPPDLQRLPGGCCFSPRCPQRQRHCLDQRPDVDMIATDHEIRCFRWKEN